MTERKKRRRSPGISVGTARNKATKLAARKRHERMVSYAFNLWHIQSPMALSPSQPEPQAQQEVITSQPATSSTLRSPNKTVSAPASGLIPLCAPVRGISGLSEAPLLDSSHIQKTSGLMPILTLRRHSRDTSVKPNRGTLFRSTTSAFAMQRELAWKRTPHKPWRGTSGLLMAVMHQRRPTSVFAMRGALEFQRTPHKQWHGIGGLLMAVMQQRRPTSVCAMKMALAWRRTPHKPWRGIGGLLMAVMRQRRYRLGACYADGSGVAIDFAEAVTWFRRAADAGDVGSMYQLACCYEFGSGVAIDFVQAVAWFRRAADAGDVGALFQLAVCYEFGSGIADLTQAVYYYQRSAEAGDRELST